MPTGSAYFASGHEPGATAPHRRRRGREVAGPYRSQSSDPTIRAQATPHEHRRVNPFDPVVIPPALQMPQLDHFTPPPPMPNLVGMLQPPKNWETAQQGLEAAALKGELPPSAVRSRWEEEYPGQHAYGKISRLALRTLASKENLGEPADLTNAILAVATLGGGLYLKGALSGADAAAGALEAGSAGQGGSTVAQTVGRALSFPLRHPVITSGSPLAAQAPLAAIKGDPGEFKKALEGNGVLADVLGGAGHAVQKAVPGVAGATLSDALSLPAQVLPSTYLAGKATVQGLQGNPEGWRQLLRSYGQTSAIPALLQGDVGEALSRAGEHPLYTALEVMAAKSAAGHGAGILARRLGIPGAGHELRPDLLAYGDVAQRQGPYSNDLITRHFQRRADQRRVQGPNGEAMMTPREVSKHLRSATDREVFAGEQVRRGNQRQVAHELNDVKPADAAQADIVSHAIQGIARNPDRVIFDLQNYRDELLAQQPNLTASELTANRKQVETIDAALANPQPDAVYNAVRTFVEQQKPITEGLVERGLLDPEQARKSIAIPYARVHMDAGYGLSRADLAEEAQIRQAMKQSGLDPTERGQLLGALSRVRAKMQTLSPAGDPLSLDAIEGHMRENGVEPADLGFVTQRPAPASGPAAFFRPPNERPSMPRQRRTGIATTQGTFDPSYEAVVQQAIHNQSLLDQTRNFEAIPERFGMRAPDGRAFADWGEGKRAAEHPEDFNMQLPEVPGGWVPFRLSPWLAKKAEIDASAGIGHNNALEADKSAMVENFSADAVKNALEPGNGPVVLVPKIVADRMRQHFQEALPIEKAAQAVTGALKNTWLPTSPKWITGNALDNYVVRAFGTGITPHDMVTGKRFAQLFKDVLTPEEQARALESIVPGGLYGSTPRIQPYRAYEQFIGSKIEPVARAAHAVLTAPGVKTVAALYRRYRDAVFSFDSKYIEQLPQYGQLAKSARHELDMTRSQFRKAVAAQEPVLMDFIRGFRNPEHIDHYAKEIERVFGNWGKNGPEARRILNTYAPFWMWGRAALKFAFITMPRDHPMLTGIIAATEQMTREERQKLGLDFAGAERLPDFLQGGIPGRESGSIVGLSGLTTYGTFADYPQFLAQSITPQLSAAVQAMQGLDWKGEQLVDAEGRPASQEERAMAAVRGTFESFVPFLNVAHSIAAHGAEGLSPAREYPPSTVQFLRERENTKTIHVPVESGGEGLGGSNPFESAELGGSGGENPFDNYQP